ncbi:MAG: FAD-binding oxidoreductase [Candidatus Acidiferrales bacterium]
MAHTKHHRNWGTPPWTIDFTPPAQPLPRQLDVAVIGGGFTGLAAAAWLRRIAPEKSLAVFEAARIGSGASGRTGGMVLGETAGGDLPGLGDVLAGFTKILSDLEIECDLVLNGAWEIGRSPASVRSPISWQDSGTLRVVKNVPGGTIDPGKLVSGLARAADGRGAILCENSRVSKISWGETIQLEVGSSQVRAEQVLFATNAMELDASGLARFAQPKFTMAVASGPLEDSQLEAIGLGERKPFYTVDLPYLWGRVMRGHEIVWGAGLVHLDDWRELEGIDVLKGEPGRLVQLVETRIRGLHPALHSVELTHRWGGPILVADSWQPVFSRHPRSQNAIVLGAYAGHGVALSVYLGCWAAEALVGRRELPKWGKIK